MCQLGEAFFPSEDLPVSASNLPLTDGHPFAGSSPFCSPFAMGLLSGSPPERVVSETADITEVFVVGPEGLEPPTPGLKGRG